MMMVFGFFVFELRPPLSAIAAVPSLAARQGLSSGPVRKMAVRWRR